MRSRFILCYFFVFVLSSLWGQEKVDTSVITSLLREGVALKEQGNFDAALRITESALNDYLQSQHNFPRLQLRLEREKGGILLDKGDYDKALIHFEQALEFAKNKFAEKDALVARFYLDVGIAHYYLGNYDLALVNYKNAERVAKTLEGNDMALLSNCYNNIGISFYIKKNYGKALDYYKKALDIRIKQFGKEDLQVASTYNNIGICYKLREDFATAIIFYDNALAIKLKKLPENHPNLAPNYNNLGSCYTSLGNFEKALDYYQIGGKILLDNFGPYHPHLVSYYNNLGNCYVELMEFPTALEYLKKAEAIRNEIYKGFYPPKGDSYGNFGDCYLRQWQYDTAIEYFQKGIDYFMQKQHEYASRIATFQSSIAYSYSLKGSYDEAINYFDKALNSVHYKDVNFEALESYTEVRLLAEILSKKAEMLVKYFSVSNNANYLREARQLFEESIVLLEFLKSDLRDSGSRQRLLDSFFSTYEGAIAVCHQSHQLTNDPKFLHKAFEYAERSNNILLQESVQKTRAEQYANIPKALLDKEQELQVDIAYFERKRFNEEQREGGGDQNQINAWNNKIFELKQNYYDLIEQFEKEYSEYYELKYAKETVSVAEIQKDLLNPNQAFLEYFVGENHIFTFVITKDTFALVYMSNPNPMEAWVDEFRNSIRYYNPLREDIALVNQKYVNLGVEFYDLLIAPIEELIQNKSLILVPGGYLGYLPFEALLKEEPKDLNDFQAYPYLIHDYSISYTYSAILHKEMMKANDNKPQNQFLGFAPRFDTVVAANPAGSRTYELGALEYNIPEVEAIGALMDGSQFLGSQATEANFLDTAFAFQIIHLATHGKANDQSSDYSFLAFYEIKDSIENELLYVKDLYNLDLQADMVVLSACETGIGDLRNGEGIISLARGFFYAGAKSIITTLWSIDDKPTAKIMELFYKNLKKGQTKDVALRNAKRSYINAQSATMKAHPRFWAGFVPVGNMEALELKGGRSFWWVWVLGGVLVLGVFWRLRR